MRILRNLTLLVILSISLFGCVLENPSDFPLCWCDRIESGNPEFSCSEKSAATSYCKVSKECCMFSPKSKSVCQIEQKHSQIGAKAGSVLSKITYFVVDPIVTQIQIVSRIIYENIVGNTAYMRIIRICLILYLIIYGVMFIYQLTPISLPDLLVRIVKIGVIVTLTTQASYSFFNDYLFKLFTSGSYDLINIVANPYCAGGDQINFFYSFNYIIDTIFSENFFFTIIALLFAYPVGWVCLIILLIIVVKYLMAIIQAMIAYLIAFTAVALLISLAPIFILLILFDRTRDLFNNWMQAIIMFSLQPAILFAGIFFVTSFVNNIIVQLFSTSVWAEILPLYIKITKDIKFKLFSFYWYVPEFFVKTYTVPKLSGSPTTYNVIDVSPKTLLSFFANLVIVYLAVNLLGKLPSFVETTARAVVSGQISIMQHGGQAMSKVGGKMKGLVGMDKASKARRRV